MSVAVGFFFRKNRGHKLTVRKKKQNVKKKKIIINCVIRGDLLIGSCESAVVGR